MCEPNRVNEMIRLGGIRGRGPFHEGRNGQAGNSDAFQDLQRKEPVLALGVVAGGTKSIRSLLWSEWAIWADPRCASTPHSKFVAHTNRGVDVRRIEVAAGHAVVHAAVH